MSQVPPTRRRWYQFSIGTMLLLVTAFAIWLGWELKFIRDRKHMAEWLDANGGLASDDPNKEISLVRRALGDLSYSHVFLGPKATPEEADAIRKLFSEAMVVSDDEWGPRRAGRPAGTTTPPVPNAPTAPAK